MKKRGYWLLAVTSIATGLVFLDNTILPVAIPSIENELQLTSSGLMWVVNSYLLSMVMLFLVGGRLTDLIGKKRCYLTGLALFALGSLLGALSFNCFCLLLGRTIQGIGAALISPTTGALLLSHFPSEKRARVIGINTGIGSALMMLGPMVGGLLTNVWGWRSIFWINLPLITYAAFMSMKLLPKGERGEGKFHFAGAIPLILSIFSFVMALMEVPLLGWSSPWVWLLILLSPLFFMLFLSFSQKTDHPLIDFSLFKSFHFRIASSAIFLIQMVVMITVFFQIYLQQERGFDALDGGLTMMLATCPVIFAAPLAGYLADRLSPRLPMLLGFAMVAFSLLWLCFFINASFIFLTPAFFGLGFGMPMIFSPAFALSMTSVPSSMLGSSSSFVMTIRQLSGTLSLALMSAVFYSTLNASGSITKALLPLLGLGTLFSLIGLFVVQKMGKKSEEQKSVN